MASRPDASDSAALLAPRLGAREVLRSGVRAVGSVLWSLVFTVCVGCQGDAPHLSVHSLLPLDAHQVEVDGDVVVESLAPQEATPYVELPEGDGPLTLEFYAVGLNGEPSPQAFDVSGVLGYRAEFDCWVVYVEPCVDEPGGLCVAAQRTTYDGLLRGCIDEPL